MSRTKMGLLIAVIVIVAIQFVQPARNQNGQVLAADITRIYAVPDSVQSILEASCYDCHSNNTRYPWHANIQPVGWWLASHIKNGKADLNFSEFANYSKRRQLSKLKSIASSVEEEKMPLPAYTVIHKNARLSKQNKTVILNWINQTKDSLSLKK